MASSTDAKPDSRDAWWRSSPGPWLLGVFLLVGLSAGAVLARIGAPIGSQPECQVESEPPVTLQGCNLRGEDLRNADLAGADLRDAFLRGADLSGSNLRGADLRGAELAGVLFVHADLAGADFEGATAAGADFTDACLDGIDSMTLDELGVPPGLVTRAPSPQDGDRPCDK